MLSKTSRRDVMRVSTGIFILGFVMVLFFFIFNIKGVEVITGALLGCGYSSLSFLLLALSLERNLSKEKKNASAAMSSGYTARLLGAAAIIIISIKLPYFNHWATIIPLFFQRIVIMIITIYDNMRKRSENN